MNNALGGISNQVDQHLFELLLVPVEMRHSLRLAFQPDTLLPQLRRHQVANLFQQRLRGHQRQFRWRGSRQQGKILEDLIHTIELASNDHGVFFFRCSFLECSLHRVQPGVDGCQRISNFVGEAGRQLFEVGQLLLLFDDRIALNQLQPKRHHHRAPVQVNDQKSAEPVQRQPQPIPHLSQRRDFEGGR